MGRASESFCQEIMGHIVWFQPNPKMQNITQINKIHLKLSIFCHNIAKYYKTLQNTAKQFKITQNSTRSQATWDWELSCSGTCRPSTGYLRRKKRWGSRRTMTLVMDLSPAPTSICRWGPTRQHCSFGETHDHYLLGWWRAKQKETKQHNKKQREIG